jgi:hypothetical protein
MSRNDAESVLHEILDINSALGAQHILPVKVKLLQACRSIAADKTPGNADGFVVHPPNEVYELLRQRDP